MGFLLRGTAALLVVTLLAPAPLLAQPAPQEPADPPARAASAGRTDMPVSLERIRRELTARTRTTERKDGLKIEYYVEVYGQAPRIELFDPAENLTSAPLKYGGMTHKEFLQVVTPEEFRSPPADIGAAVAALVKYLSKKRQPEESRR